METRIVEIVWTIGNSRYYINKGYVFTSFGDNFYVDINDLPRQSKIKINVECKMCKKIFNVYNESRMDTIQKYGEYYCKECKVILRRDENKKYGNWGNYCKENNIKLGRKSLGKQSIIDLFAEKGAIVIEDQIPENVLVTDEVSFICLKHSEKGIQKRKRDSVKTSVFACIFCNKEIKKLTIKHSIEEAKEAFELKDAKLITNTYKNIDEKMIFICNKHPEAGEQKASLYSALKYQTVCKICKYESLSNKNHWNWQGGIGLERDSIKQKQEYKDWVINVFRRDNFTCQCCGKSKIRLNAHHLYQFSKYALSRLDINNGITLCENCHSINNKNSFHNLYGTQNTYPEDLYEYIQRHQAGEFDETG